MIEKKRNYHYDLIRFFAILLIVLCHSVEAIYSEKLNNISMQSNLFYIIVHSISRLGVPLFLFLTGSLLLNKKYENKEDIKNFYKHNLFNLIIVCEIWYIIYYILDILIFKKTFAINQFIPVLFFLNQYPLSHAWYIPMIVGIYVTIPFVGIIVQKFPKIIKNIMYVNILYIFGIPMINIILESLNIKYIIPTSFSMPFGGGAYGIYVMVGYFLTKYCKEQSILKNINKVLIIGIAIIAFMITVLIRCRLKCDSWYNMFTILICSSCIFVLLQKVKLSVKTYKILEKLSIGAFGVYLVHIIFINFFNKYGLKELIRCKLPIKVVIYFILIIITSYTIVWLLSKNKYTRKYLLFIK